MTPTRRLLGIALACALVLGGPTGCLLGSPVAAFSGEPWGMTRDDWSALGGKKRGPIWGGAPVFAAVDLPFAFVLDTALIPIAGLIWLIRLAAGDSNDSGHGHGHGAGSDHSHDLPEDDGPIENDPTARDAHDDGTAHEHGPDSHTHDLTADDPPAPPPSVQRSGHQHGDFVFHHHHGDGDFEHTHAGSHHHGDGILEHEHGNGDTQHAHLSDHHHGDYDLDHHHGDAKFDHAHKLGEANVYPADGR